MSKEYSEEKRIGNEGVAYLEFLMTKYCLMHKVDESKDIGNDYFCEWTYNGVPSRVPFWIQVKTTKQEVKIITVKEKNKNLLKSVDIKGASHFNINQNTVDYWSGFQIPVYFFCIVLGERENKCFYKRFTPILHSKKYENEKFYQVSEGNNFFAFGDEKNKSGGFVRDLFVDYIRCNYKIGSLAYRNPRELGLMQFPESEETVFGDVIKDYEEEINKTVKKLRQLGVIEGSSTSPSSSSGSIVGTSSPSPSQEYVDE